MGDMADMLIDSFWDIDHEQDDDYDEVERRFKICRCCGTGQLHWEGSAGKWRLCTEDRKIHVCPVNPIKEKQSSAPRMVTDPIEKAFRAGFKAGADSASLSAHPPIGISMPETKDEAWTRFKKTL